MDYRFILKNKKYLSSEINLIKSSYGYISVCAIYPNYYEIAMSSLSFQFLYEMLNFYPELLVERCYLPSNQLINLVISKYLASFESAIPLTNFNILAFSISYEADFINVLRIFKLAKIPFEREIRLKYDYPLIVCGGPVTFQNILPMYEIFDIISIGLGEITIDTLIKKYIEIFNKKLGIKQTNIKVMEELANNENFFIPMIMSKKSVIYLKNNLYSNEKFAKTIILTSNTEFKNRALIEVVRGCQRSCRFCIVPVCYGKVRYNDIDNIINYIDIVRKYTNQIGLLGPTVSSYPHLDKIYEQMLKFKLDISMSSLYIGDLNETIIKLISNTNQKYVTFALESASNKVRQLVGKFLNDDEILFNLNNAINLGIKNIKIYLILGLYDFFNIQSDETLDTINFLIEIINYIKKLKIKVQNIKLSINPLIIKPRTKMCNLIQNENTNYSSFIEFYKSKDYIFELENRYQKIISALKSLNVEFSEKNFLDHYLLKLINECNINLFDFFDDFFYNEPKSAKQIIKIMSSKNQNFNFDEVLNNLFIIKNHEY